MVKLKREDKIKIIKIVIILCAGLVSFFYFGNRLSEPNTYGRLIKILDDKKANVMGLTASTSGASIAITTLPNDIGTPIANQLANLSTYLLAVLTVIYLEKYLLTIIGFAVCKIIIPIACILYIIYILLPHNFALKKVSVKLVAFGIAMLLIIPTSVTVSDMIDKTYEQSINETINVVNQDTKVEENKHDVSKPSEELKWYEKIYTYFNNALEDIKQAVDSSASEAVNKAKNILSNFIEATAVMIVTSCIVPILTVLVFIWLVKVILGIEMPKPELLKFSKNLMSNKVDRVNTQEP